MAPLTHQPQFVRGVELFNAGHWWEAHEAWETVWHAAQGQDRLLVQGFILLAAALHKRWHHGSLTGRNFIKAQTKWAELPDQLHGLSLRELQGAVARALNDSQYRPQIVLADVPTTSEQTPSKAGSIQVT